MKIKAFLFALIMLQLSNNINAQENLEDYILIEKKDTIFCHIDAIIRVGGQVRYISYIDKNKQEIIIRTKADIKKVKSLRVGGYILDYIPMKPSKPDSYKRHTYRRVDGKIKYYDFKNLECATNDETNKRIISVGGVATVNYSIMLDNGKHYDQTNGNIKKYIIPYMQKNSYFKNNFKKEVTKDNIKDAIDFYNNSNDSDVNSKPIEHKKTFIFKTYSDFKAKKSLKAYDEVDGYAKPNYPIRFDFILKFKNFDSSKKYNHSAKSIWGFNIENCVFRTNHGFYMYGPYFKIMSVNKLVYYEQGPNHVSECWNSNTALNVEPTGAACFISKDLESKIVPLYGYMAEGKYNKFKKENPEHKKLYEAIDKVKKIDKYDYKGIRNAIIEYNKK